MRNVNLEENELTITAIFQQHTKEETIQTLKEALEVLEQEVPFNFLFDLINGLLRNQIITYNAHANKVPAFGCRDFTYGDLFKQLTAFFIQI